jgi:hypothetical protein
MLPPAPALLSMMIVCFSAVDITRATWRERLSALPPAAYGQTQVISLLGYLSWASVIAGNGSAAAAPVACSNVRRLMWESSRERERKNGMLERRTRCS